MPPQITSRERAPARGTAFLLAGETQTLATTSAKEPLSSRNAAPEARMAHRAPTNSALTPEQQGLCEGRKK